MIWMAIDSRKLMCHCRIPILLALMLVLPHAAAGEEFLLWKAYAGETIDSGGASYDDNYSKPTPILPPRILREVRRNRQENAVVPDFSVIKCESNRNFGIVYYVIFDEARTASFDLTWHFPHLEKEIGRTSRSTKMTARMPLRPKRRWQLYSAFWSLRKDELKEGDFTLILHRGEDVLVHHVFQIRGCESS